MGFPPLPGAPGKSDEPTPQNQGQAPAFPPQANTFQSRGVDPSALSQVFQQTFNTGQPATAPSQPAIPFPQPPTTFPQQATAFPQPQTTFPQQVTAFPQPQTAFPQQAIGFPQQTTAFPQPQTAFPQQAIGFPQPTSVTAQPFVPQLPQVAIPNPASLSIQAARYPAPSTGFESARQPDYDRFPRHAVIRDSQSSQESSQSSHFRGDSSRLSTIPEDRSAVYAVPIRSSSMRPAPSAPHYSTRAIHPRDSVIPDSDGEQSESEQGARQSGATSRPPRSTSAGRAIVPYSGQQRQSSQGRGPSSSARGSDTQNPLPRPSRGSSRDITPHIPVRASSASQQPKASSSQEQARPAPVLRLRQQPGHGSSGESSGQGPPRPGPSRRSRSPSIPQYPTQPSGSRPGDSAPLLRLRQPPSYAQPDTSSGQGPSRPDPSRRSRSPSVPQYPTQPSGSRPGESAPLLRLRQQPGYASSDTSSGQGPSRPRRPEIPLRQSSISREPSVSSQQGPHGSGMSQTRMSKSRPDSIPRAIEFKHDYRLDETKRPPPELRGSHPLQRATKGQQGWAKKFVRIPGSSVSSRKGKEPERSDSADQIWYWVAFKDSDGLDQQGWVPEHYVYQGKPQADPLPIVNIKDSIKRRQIQRGSAKHNNVFYHTLRGLFQGIHDNRSELIQPIINQSPHLVRQVGSALNDTDFEELVECLYDNLNPEVKSLFLKGRFDPRELIQGVDRPRTVDNVYPGREFAGCYLLVSNDVTPERRIQVLTSQDARDALYGGQSGDFYNRLNYHRYNLDKQDQLSYQILRTGKNFCMIPIFMFRRNDPRVAKLKMKNLIDFAELALVCLFRSWNPLLLRQSVTRAQMGSFCREYQYAQMLSRIMENVSEETGWSPRPTVGTNFLTPVFSDMLSERIWVGWYDHGRKSWFFRTRQKVNLSSKDKRWDASEDKASIRIGYHSGGKLFIPAEVQKEAQFENGDTGHMLVEIKCDENFQNFRPHEFQFARVPSIAKNREHEKLASMSVTYEWCKKEDGTTKWKGAAVQRRHAHATIQNTNELASVAAAMNLFAILTQTVYTGQPPSWLLPYDRNAVKILKYNHLEQTYTLQSLQPNTIVWPPNNTVDQNRQRLKTAIQGKDKHTKFDDRPHKMRKNRTACDFCVSLATSSPPCDWNANRRSCSRCMLFNRPCTFSEHPTEHSSPDLLKTGGTLSELGCPISFHRAVDAAQTPAKRDRGVTRVHDLEEAPFAAEIETQVIAEEEDCKERESKT